jgi:hypothetical protein
MEFLPTALLLGWTVELGRMSTTRLFPSSPAIFPLLGLLQQVQHSCQMSQSPDLVNPREERTPICFAYYERLLLAWSWAGIWWLTDEPAHLGCWKKQAMRQVSLLDCEVDNKPSPSGGVLKGDAATMVARREIIASILSNEWLSIQKVVR